MLAITVSASCVVKRISHWTVSKKRKKRTLSPRVRSSPVFRWEAPAISTTPNESRTCGIGSLKTSKMLNMTDDIGASFGKLISHIFPRYRGVLLERHNGGWRWMGKVYYSKEDLDRAIDEAGNSLSNSINNLKHEKKKNNDTGA